MPGEGELGGPMEFFCLTPGVPRMTSGGRQMSGELGMLKGKCEGQSQAWRSEPYLHPGRPLTATQGRVRTAPPRKVRSIANSVAFHTSQRAVIYHTDFTQLGCSQYIYQ